MVHLIVTLSLDLHLQLDPWCLAAALGACRRHWLSESILEAKPHFLIPRSGLNALCSSSIPIGSSAMDTAMEYEDEDSDEEMGYEYDPLDVMDNIMVWEGSESPVTEDMERYSCSQSEIDRYQYPSNNNRAPFASLTEATLRHTLSLERPASLEEIRALYRLRSIFRGGDWDPSIIITVLSDLDKAFLDSSLWGNTIVRWVTTDELISLNRNPRVYGVTRLEGKGRCTVYLNSTVIFACKNPHEQTWQTMLHESL